MNSNSYFVMIMLVSVLALAQLSMQPAHAQASTDLATFKPKAPERPRPSLLLDFSITNYGAKIDGKTDDTNAFVSCFAAVAEAGGGRVTIPPGDYYLAGGPSIQISSNTHVIATGARFLLPKLLGTRARITLFQGEDVVDFIWEGGYFEGHCFDPARDDNTWEPNASTRIIAITTTRLGQTARLMFRNMAAKGIAGGVVNVSGLPMPGSESDVLAYATDISITNCVFLESGQFMWDYGYLWQRLVWPDEGPAREQQFVRKYFPRELLHSGVVFEANSERVLVDNNSGSIKVGDGDKPDFLVCFFGGTLPANIKRGRAYYVAEATPEYIKVAEKAGGAILKFDEGSRLPVSLVRNMKRAYWYLMSPEGSADGKGAIDLRACRNSSIIGCRLSSHGDAMHIQRCSNHLFERNEIVSARMGALFIAEFCYGVVVQNNIINGTNGSRVMSLEKSCNSTKIIGNIFKGAGRGSWINQPTNLLIERNTFNNNTTKGERDPERGRRNFNTGEYEAHSEMYFTLYQPEGRYARVTIRDNVFTAGPEAIRALAFLANGSDIEVIGNTFNGAVRTIEVHSSCRNVKIRDNPGAVILGLATR